MAGSVFCPGCGASTTPVTEICPGCGARVAKQKDNSLPVATHVLGLFTGWLAPLIILLVTGEEHVKNHARMALNWQLSLLIYAIVSGILTFIIVGWFLLVAVFVLDVIFCIMAAVKAGRGELWQYPLSIPFLKARFDSSGTTAQ